MSYPTFTAQDLADFTGRPFASYVQPYTSTAIAQASLLFKIATCLTDWPLDPDNAMLAQLGLLSMADSLVLLQPYQKILANPMQSESIGSYSYSKMAQATAKAAGNIKDGTPTGIVWFDLAVQQLGVCEVNGTIYSTAIAAFENDASFATDSTGQKLLLGPADFNTSWDSPLTNTDEA